MIVASKEPCRTPFIVSSKNLSNSLRLFRDRLGRSSVEGRDGIVTLCPCLDPIFADSSGSAWRAHCFAPVRAHAPHLLPMLFFAEHLWDMQLFRNLLFLAAQPAGVEPYVDHSPGDEIGSFTCRSPAVRTALHILRSLILPSVALHVVECTFQRGFEFLRFVQFSPVET